MSPTIRSLAIAAGVSRGTVDRVLNGRPGVNPKVRKHVMALAAELGYKPNRAGRALAFQKNPLKIGFILLDGSDPLFQEVRAGVETIEAELAGQGVQVDFRAMTRISAAEQIRCLRALGRGPLAGLVLAPLDDPAVAEELARLVRRTGAHLVTYNFDEEHIKRLCFVGADLRRMGRVAGGLTAKLLGGQGPVLVVSGTREIKSHRERLEGFCEVLGQDYPGLRIAHTIHGVTGNDDTYREVSAYLAGHPLPRAIFITGVGLGGVGRALREAGRPDVRVVCYDRRPETEALLREGIVDFTITQDPFMQGYQPVKLLFDYLINGKLPAAGSLFTKAEIQTRECL